MELKVDLSRADKLKEKYVNDALESLEKLINKNGKGSEFTGWVELPKNINEDNIVRIEKLAAKMRKKCGCFSCYWNRRILSWGKGCYRSFKKDI